MKKNKLYSVFIILTLFELVFFFFLVTQYKERIISGQIDSFADFITKSHLYLTLIPFVFGIIGPFLKNRIGWTLTISVFYLLAMLGIAAAFTVKINSLFEIITFILYLIFVTIPIVLMNGSISHQFYKIEKGKKLIIENVLAILMMIVCSVLLVILNG